MAAEGKSTHMNGHSDVKDDDNDTRAAECGIGRFKPKALEKCANIAAFTGVYGVCSLLSQTLNAYMNSQVTTLERQFGFSSSQTGIIMAANDLGFLTVVLFISYVASKVHIPRALGLVNVILGLSGIVCAMPHFLYGAPSPPSVGLSTDTLTSSRQSRSFSGQVCDVSNDTSSGCEADVETADVNISHASNEMHIRMVLQDK